MNNSRLINKKSVNEPSVDYQKSEFSEKNQNNRITEKLIESEMRYRRLFETAKDGILILDFKNGNIVDANPFIVDIIDYSLDEILGKQLWEIGLFNNKKQSKLAFTELRANNYIRFEDMPLRKRNGVVVEVEFISNVYLVNKTKVIQCNIREISERKQAERNQELTIKILSILNRHNEWQQLLNDILVEIKNYTESEAVAIRLKDGDDFPYYEAKGYSEDFIRKEKYLCTHNENGVLILDEKGNPLLKCICGYILTGETYLSLPLFTKKGSFYSNNIATLTSIVNKKEKLFPTNIPCIREGYKSVALIPLHSGKEIIGLLQLNDKRPDMFSYEMIHFLEEIGNTIGIAFGRIQSENKIRESEQNLKKQIINYSKLNKKYLSLNEGLTKSLHRVQKMNGKLIHAKAMAEESDRLKSAFLSNMSHEIRTPMNAIMGFSGFLTEPGLPTEKIKKFVKIINTSSQQLLSVISDIIDISKIETGQINFDLQWVNINLLLNELNVIYKRIVEPGKIDLICSYGRPDEQFQVETDGNRIKQVFCNLLNNAIKFTKEGNIEFGYKVKKNFIEFYVKDTGIGIEQEYHDLIFQRFRQIDSSETSAYGGNGLGLSISKALIEMLGGTITVDSKSGVGSNFIFTIPSVIKNEKPTVPKLTAEIHRFNNKNEKTILIVEDETSNHAYIEALFSGENVRILHAWDGKEALEQVKNHTDISLVLMDIKLPIMNGYEATRLIKQINPKLPVIAQTAYALSNDKEQALKAELDPVCFSVLGAACKKR